LFQQTFSMFKPFVPPRGGNSAPPSRRRLPAGSADAGNIDDLRRR